MVGISGDTSASLYFDRQFAIQAKPAPESQGNWCMDRAEEEMIKEMKITEVKSVSSKPNPHNVDARAISDTESAQVVHITLQPGEAPQ